MNSIEKEKYVFFIVIFLIDSIIFFLSHYFCDSFQFYKKIEIINVPIEQKRIETLIEVPKVIIQQEIQKPIIIKEEEIEDPIEFDDDKGEDVYLLPM